MKFVMSENKLNLCVFPNLEDLNHFAAEKFISIGNEAIKEKGFYSVSLSGGSTPKAFYKLLSGEKYRNKIDWNKVFFFFGDERNVLPGDEQSNYRMANENLFIPLQITDENVFRWQTELQDAGLIAEKYEQSIKTFFDLSENEFPRSDLILLGMGDDGHTASLFPYTKALNENRKIAVTNRIEKLATTRLTLTFPALNNAANIIFLVAGEDKAETLGAVLEGDFQPEKYPSQNIKSTDGNLFWLVDANAGKMLSGL